MLTRLGPILAIVLLTVPVVFGLAGTLLPAFGYLPALGGTMFELAPFRQLLAEPAILSSAVMSLVVGLVTAAFSIVSVMLFTAAWGGTRIFMRMQHLISPLLSVPHAGAAFALAFLIAPSGMIARLISPELTGWERPPDLLIVHDPMGLSMMTGLIVKEIPFLLLVTLAALPLVKPARTRALIASMGYGRISGFVFGLWPSIYPQIRLPVFAVIAFATSVVDVATILGPTTPAPLAVRLVRWMNDPDLSMRFLASAGAVLQLGVTATAIVIWMGLEKFGAFLRERLACAGRRYRSDSALRIGVLVVMLVSAGAIFIGMAALALWSVAGLWQYPDLLPARFEVRNWKRVLPNLMDPLATTLSVAVVSTLIAVVIAVLCFAREDETSRSAGRGALTVLYLPLLVPQVAFLFGLQLFFILVGIEATWIALVFVHLVFVLPYAWLSLRDPWRAFDRRYDQIAAGLGQGAARRFFLVRLPMMTRPLLAVAAIGFSVSIGLYLPTVLIGAGRLTTITTEAVALASGGNRRVIGIYAFMQMVLPAAGFAVATIVPALIFRRYRDMHV
ncbi:ABC transporter permease [Nitratireductor kimnyeongensis]|uniref:ABC transporter permease n=1 Tax=Nitratireductor kimnyeongensis TaxID=430679 RepID=A0ABW0T6K0_9HYPH|nr:ABC transporter permease [Nitratireductor kimnyeongensis]QZZ34307.1 ABC transporter permease [Nitratireductor kimnyeongensis]